MEYNPVWIDRTFKSRQLTEYLLAPEREAGLLTTHDYDAALSFFPNFHRHYNVRSRTTLYQYYTPAQIAFC